MAGADVSAQRQRAAAALPTAATHGMHGAGRGRSLLPPRRAARLAASLPRAFDTSAVPPAPHYRIRPLQRTMLQQMSSPPSVHIGEVASLVRLEGRVCGDASSEASSDAAEDGELPQCKIRRNYNCTKCTFYTQNPRVYLVHTRDVHFEKFKIYDCPHCVYASRHHQKLVRHIKMVHAAPPLMINMDMEPPPPPVPSSTVTEPEERIEDLVEEVEDTDDVQIELEDAIEESIDRSVDMEVDVDRTVAEESSELPKDKTKYFSCTKCNYVTHIRARFTKHVKYHSMPMIKCTMCDFRTPYKWNLDRHMKNHGGTGSFNCSMCNFTADIKQSLTVHEMNHHTPPVGQSVASRRRNRVGASDIALADAALALVAKEEEGSGDSRSSHASEMGLQYADIEMISCTSDNDTSTEVVAKKDSELAQEPHNRQSPNSTSGEAKSNKQSRKIPRPIPQLIPLNTSTPNQNKSPPGEPPIKKFKVDTSEVNIIDNIDSLPTDITLIPVNNGTPVTTKEPAVKKKNESFFDRLKERLLTATGEEGTLTCKNCGFESKCLSEHSVHEKNCTVSANRVLANNTHTSLGSTRCQNCRHRCKSSADLYVHMQTCGKQNKVADEPSDNNETKSEATSSTHENDVAKDEPHPMENVVFVWNNINTDATKFETPLDININDDSTMPESSKNYDSEVVDENEVMNLSPSQAAGKKVFKCPHCTFWASTASRFHVHIVGHLNKKPFECSLCKYKSNWRWDITKHIKLKSARDPEHNEAKVLMTDETGRRNYSKYNKFFAIPVINEYGETEFEYLDANLANGSVDIDESYDTNDTVNTTLEMQPLNLQTGEHRFDTMDDNNEDKKPKKTLWKCKKCNYKDPSKEALLAHVREHSKPEDGHEDKPAFNKKPENTPDPADLAYRCGHCNQLSNWKHVIQRHCRLKHDGVIKVITTVKPKPDASSLLNEMSDTCTKCPFKAVDKKQLLSHMQQHQPSPQSIFKCYFCPYFVKTEHDLLQHLALHGVTDPEDYISKAMGCKSPLPEQSGPSGSSTSTKRHKCAECPYETNSKSQFMYHEQFHRLPADTPYKCQECNYSVSKRHLLHQHMRVHGIMPKKTEMELEMEASTPSFKSDSKMDIPIDLNEIPFVWVSAKNEFHKMYKCRYCSYVNSQKCKIPNHEKIHCIVFENSEIKIYKCLECKFTCDNAGRLAEHSRTHGEIYGRIYCPVESDVPDEEQIAKLRKVIETEKVNNSDSPREETTQKDGDDVKILFFCHKCPARFFIDSELRIHDKFHDLLFENKCKYCEFSVPQETELTAHLVCHSDEYATETKMLKFKHRSHPAHKDPKVEIVHCPAISEVNWIVTAPSKNYEIVDSSKKCSENKVPRQYFCKECPAKFFKTSALSYHMGLHGGDGEHKCKKCSYTVKNLGNLAKHESLHENEGKNTTCDYESGEDNDYKNIPLSGTDLFQRKTEAQKRVNIIKDNKKVVDKNKLVKPNDHFPPVLQADPQFGYLMHGNPEFIYPTYLKNGRQKEKRYKCHKCPSAFEKREQYKIHLSLHGSKQRYKCEVCDYSVKYYANYVQHMRKHQMNDEALAERKKSNDDTTEAENETQENTTSKGTIKLAIKTMPKGTARPKSDFQQFSVSDQQTLRLLQLRRSINNAVKEKNPEPTPTKERKLHMCLLCPYTNQRQDALTNHYKRHDENLSASNGTHKCPHCDLVVVQSHFLREHLKTHFNYQKHLAPECFVASEGMSFVVKQLDDEDDIKDEDQTEIKDDDDEKIKVETIDVSGESNSDMKIDESHKFIVKKGPKFNLKIAVKEDKATEFTISLDEKITFDSNENKVYVKLKTGELVLF